MRFDSAAVNLQQLEAARRARVGSDQDRIRAAACLNFGLPVDSESRISIASHGMHAWL